MKKTIRMMSVVLAVMLLVSCAPAAAPASVEVAPKVAFQLSGLAEKSWSVEELKALPVTQADYQGKDGKTITYQGVSFADLFKAAGISDYASVKLIAADDYSVEIDKAALSACSNCIVAIADDGALRSVMPGMDGKSQVKDLVKIEVK